MIDTYRVLVVDDEPAAREGTCALIEQDDELRLVGACASGATAAAAILDDAPDIAVLDIQMPDLDGFGCLELIDPVLRPEIVFLTAYEEYARRAFDWGAVDYVLKPFSDARLSLALDRAKTRVRAKRARRHYLTRLAIRSGDSVLMISVADIDWIEGADYYSRVHVGSKSHLIRLSLKRLERQLDPALFIRVHRSALVNSSRIKKVVPHADLGVVLTSGVELPLSRRLRPRVEAHLRSTMR